MTSQIVSDDVSDVVQTVAFPVQSYPTEDDKFEIEAVSSGGAGDINFNIADVCPQS